MRACVFHLILGVLGLVVLWVCCTDWFGFGSAAFYGRSGVIVVDFTCLGLCGVVLLCLVGFGFLVRVGRLVCFVVGFCTVLLGCYLVLGYLFTICLYFGFVGLFWRFSGLFVLVSWF